MSVTPRDDPFPRARIGVSSCLLGQRVRFDGGHKRDDFVTGPLAELFEYVPVCPEVGIGMTVPREPIRLVGDAARPRAVAVRNTALDVTGDLERFARQQVGVLGDISGYIFKKGSPSCGMERIRVYQESGMAEREASGIYARVIRDQMPLLPVEDEGRLNDAVLRENFVNRVFVYRRWQILVESGLAVSRLIQFHADHKYLVMAHSQAANQRLGRLLSNLSGIDLGALGDEYVRELMTALTRRVTRKRHSNVLYHIMGYLKHAIDGGDKAELVQTIEAYRRGEVPLVVPITLLRHYFRRHPDPYMERQHYLRPHPDQLSLRNAL